MNCFSGGEGSLRCLLCRLQAFCTVYTILWEGQFPELVNAPVIKSRRVTRADLLSGPRKSDVSSYSVTEQNRLSFRPQCQQCRYCRRRWRRTAPEQGISPPKGRLRPLHGLSTLSFSRHGSLHVAK